MSSQRCWHKIRKGNLAGLRISRISTAHTLTLGRVSQIFSPFIKEKSSPSIYFLGPRGVYIRRSGFSAQLSCHTFRLRAIFFTGDPLYEGWETPYVKRYLAKSLFINVQALLNSILIMTKAKNKFGL